jgi:hypothetical protein
VLRRRRAMNQGWLILLEQDAWRIVSPDAYSERTIFPPEMLAAQAPLLRESLIAAGWRGEPVVMGLSADCCVAVTVPVPAPQMLRKRQAMRYHMEGWIPWSAEEYVADYAPHQTEAFMVAARCEPLKQLLSGLEELDVSVVVLVPSALLALGQHLATADAPPDHVLIWQADEGADLFVVRRGQPLSWMHAAEDLASLVGMAALKHATDLPWFARGFEPHQLASLGAASVHPTLLSGLEWRQALQGAATGMGAGESEPLVNLRRDELAAERPTRALARQLIGLKIAATLAFLGLCAAFWIKGDRFAVAADAGRGSLKDVYASVFPKNPVPDQVVGALRKEQGLLRGTRGVAQALPEGPSCDALLGNALRTLPTDMRFRVPEVRIEGSSVYLSAEVRANSDADRIATELRNGGFAVEPPHTQRLAEQGFSVRLSAAWPAAAQEARKR